MTADATPPADEPTPTSPPPAAASGIERVPTMACGVQGCLAAAVSIFVIIILAAILILFLRMSEGGEDSFGSAARAEVVNIRQDTDPLPAVPAALAG